jgi:cardiolipin synthase
MPGHLWFGGATSLLLTRPGLGSNPLQAALCQDLAGARDVRITSAYFLPNRILRNQLFHAVRRGARVELMLAGRSDVAVSQWATRGLYRRLLKAGITLHEYQPQVLHSKIIVVDDIVYAGSSNLDPRSLRLNFEVMLRIQDPGLAASVRRLFADNVTQSAPVTRDGWQARQTLWTRLQQRIAFFLLTRVDVEWTLGRLQRLQQTWKKIRSKA